MARGKICKIESCKKILNVTAGQICQMHRSRWFRNKSYEIPKTSPYLKYHKPALTKLGYIRINIDGKRILEHTHIMQQHLGRKLKPQERIHHINHNKTDNRIENLQLFANNSEHIKKGHAIRWHERKDRFPMDVLNNIFLSLARPSNPSHPCFCGNKFMARNLCPKHYGWANRHNFISKHT